MYLMSFNSTRGEMGFRLYFWTQLNSVGSARLGHCILSVRTGGGGEGGFQYNAYSPSIFVSIFFKLLRYS